MFVGAIHPFSAFDFYELSLIQRSLWSSLSEMDAVSIRRQVLRVKQ